MTPERPERYHTKDRRAVRRDRDPGWVRRPGPPKLKIAEYSSGDSGNPMLNAMRSLALVLCALMVSGTAVWGQDPTETATRRPTPSFTPTRTNTVLATVTRTPTFRMGGTETFLCSAGTRDGLECANDPDCPGGVCVLAQGICRGGGRDGDYCEETSDCGEGGACLLSHRVCLSGDKEGVSCLGNDQCPDSECISSGLFCDGGDFDLYACINDDSCIGEIESGICRSPFVLLCNGGRNDGALCRSDLECPAGTCVVAQGACAEVQNTALPCQGDIQCPGGACIFSSRICSGGVNKSLPCLGQGNCPGASCVATGRVCAGGNDYAPCVDDTSCEADDGTEGECIVPGPNFYCSGGPADAELCSFDGDCPEGACVFSQGLCEGGPDDSDYCDTSADCGGGAPCLQTQKVCLAGDFTGYACLNNDQCGSGVVCASSGLRCDGGVFEDYSCVVDDNCCNEDGCNDDEEDGFCRSPDVLLCSAGANDAQECIGHFECPGGACVLAQKVCDGGADDGFGCEADVNCRGGARCVPSARVCSGGDDDSFGCLRNEHCRGGTCVATGQVCDGGDAEDEDYDPFLILYSCTNTASCFDETLVCVSPTPQGLACSAGSRDGQTCELHDDCPGGVCVLQDVLCDGGAVDAFFCDTNADCPGGRCQATRLVCEFSGLSCTNPGQCDTERSERCLASGRVCEGATFGAYSCVDDFNCYDPESPDSETGACVGSTPRLCSLEAPCLLAGQSVGQVFGFSVNPFSSPATFDFFLVPIEVTAAGTVVVLRPSGGDADLFVGRSVSAQIFSDAYPFASRLNGDTTDSVRISPSSTPSFAEFTDQLAEFAVAVAGAGGETTYRLFNVFLGNSAPGDANCDGAVDGDDREGLIDALFDPATRLTSPSSAFGRCLGGDGNGDGAESVADLIAVAIEAAAP